MRAQKLTCVDVWQNTTLCDCDVTEQLVQLLIVSDGELQVTWDDTGLLVVASCVTGQLENFGSEVLKNGSEVDGSTWWIKCQREAKAAVGSNKLTSTNTLGVVALSQQTVDMTDWECETGL